MKFSNLFNFQGSPKFTQIIFWFENIPSGNTADVFAKGTFICLPKWQALTANQPRPIFA
jgi:hypothetical protein